jgi:hypothetical protein
MRSIRQLDAAPGALYSSTEGSEKCAAQTRRLKLLLAERVEDLHGENYFTLLGPQHPQQWRQYGELDSLALLLLQTSMFQSLQAPTSVSLAGIQLTAGCIIANGC